MFKIHIEKNAFSIYTNYYRFCLTLKLIYKKRFTRQPEIGHFVFEEKIEHQKIDAASLDYFRLSICS